MALSNERVFNLLIRSASSIKRSCFNLGICMNKLIELAKKYDSATFPVSIHVSSGNGAGNEMRLDVYYFVGGELKAENQRVLRGFATEEFIQQACDWLTEEYHANQK